MNQLKFQIFSLHVWWGLRECTVYWPFGETHIGIDS